MGNIYVLCSTVLASAAKPKKCIIFWQQELAIGVYAEMVPAMPILDIDKNEENTADVFIISTIKNITENYAFFNWKLRI